MTKPLAERARIFAACFYESSTSVILTECADEIDHLNDVLSKSNEHISKQSIARLNAELRLEEAREEVERLSKKRDPNWVSIQFQEERDAARAEAAGYRAVVEAVKHFQKMDAVYQQDPVCDECREYRSEAYAELENALATLETK